LGGDLKNPAEDGLRMGKSMGNPGKMWKMMIKWSWT